MDIPRPEHPRPDFYRPDWLNLNGSWQFEFDGVYPLHGDQEALTHTPSKEIIVPFPYQSPLSGIGTTGIFPCVWYRKSFETPKSWTSKKVLLHFGAVDYHARVWLNGVLLGEHRGGHVPFSFDITPYLKEQENEVTVRVFDGLDIDQPRGKQSWGIQPPAGIPRLPASGKPSGSKPSRKIISNLFESSRNLMMEACRCSFVPMVLARD
jgi:hypothetical protein